MHDVGVGAQQTRGVGGARERDDVLHGQLVEQAGRAAAEQLQGALGQDPGLDDAADAELGEVRRLRGRLHDRRHPGDERRRELLEEPPDREVERVDLDRDARPRGVDVLADELALPAELLEPAVDVHHVVGHLADALAGHREQRAEAAVDVDHRVALGRASAEGQVVELVLDPGLRIGQVLGDVLDERRALVERQCAEGGTADGAGVRRHLPEVEPGRRDAGDLLARGPVQQGLALVVCGVPAAGGVALEHRGSRHGRTPRAGCRRDDPVSQ